MHTYQQAPPSPVTSLRSTSSSGSCIGHPTSTYSKVENHLNGCNNCEATYRSLQQENHDLRKRLGQFKARLVFANGNLRQEGARQRVLEQCVAKLSLSLEEVHMRSIDVLEENHVLRANLTLRTAHATGASPEIPQTPLDRQLLRHVAQVEEADHPTTIQDATAGTSPTRPSATEPEKALSHRQSRTNQPWFRTPQEKASGSPPTDPAQKPESSSSAIPSPTRNTVPTARLAPKVPAPTTRPNPPHRLHGAKRLPRPSLPIPAPNTRIRVKVSSDPVLAYQLAMGHRSLPCNTAGVNRVRDAPPMLVSDTVLSDEPEPMGACLGDVAAELARFATPPF